jgi:hypothetical protein
MRRRSAHFIRARRPLEAFNQRPNICQHLSSFVCQFNRPLASAAGPYMLQKIPRAYLPLEASLLCCDLEHLSKDTVLSEDIPLRNTLDLALPDHMHHLIALQSPLGGTE